MVESTLPDMLKAGTVSSGLDRASALTLCRALADPTRLELMASIWGGERCVCDLQESVGGKPQNVVSHHLAQLRQAVMVQARRDGRWVYYRPADSLSAEMELTLTLLLGPRGHLRSDCQ
ncbi:MAG TPA: metalloregulator ArsR/SmtB family transcription factor [Clostridia bacterium]|nr:metalloregulator ArsR/SmtB family transcription factor [Clostridia bacterium]